MSIAGAARKQAGMYYDKGGMIFNADHPDFGIKGDGKKVADGAITTGTPTLTSATAAFTSADAGKPIGVGGAGAAGAVLATTILAYVNATTVTLNANAGTTVSGAQVMYGTDDSSAAQGLFNEMPLAGGRFHFGPKLYLMRNIAPPLLASYKVSGAGMTATTFAPPPNAAVNPVFDLSNSNGPAKTFEGAKIIGANQGYFQSAGFKCSTTNGLILRSFWLAGLLSGVDWINSSFLDSLGVVIEACGIGFWLRTAPIEVVIGHTTYFQNAQDLDVTGACKTFRHSRSTSIGSTNTAVYAHDVTDFALSDFGINTAVVGINLTNAPDSILENGIMTDNTNDFVNSGTVRLYAHNVKANFAPFEGAGIYYGTLRGGKRRMIGTGMPNSLSWNANDTVEDLAAGVGKPKKHLRLTTGSGNVVDTDWKPEDIMQGTSANRGDTSQTLTLGTDAPTQRWATTLTANRTVTLSTTGAYNGAKFRVVRTGLGAFTLDIGGLKTIPSATAAFVDVEYDGPGAAWRLAGYGAL